MSTSPGTPNIKNPPTIPLAGAAKATPETVPLSEGLSHLSEKTLAQIKARADAATAPPWEVCSNTPKICSHVRADGLDTACLLHSNRWNDAEFIAHARADIPLLLAHIEALQGRLDAVVQP